MKKFVLLLISAALCTSVIAQKELYEKRWFIRGADTLPFRILLPVDYEPSKKYPLLVFLHGAGERGRDNEKQLVHGSSLFASAENRKAFPAIVIFPQCASNDYWARMQAGPRKDNNPPVRTYATESPMGTSLGLVNQLLDSMAASGSVNKRKIFIGGLSMGGMGTFEILWRKPDFFAAAFAICGGGAESKVPVYGKKFPIWVFHGSEDAVVNVEESRNMVAALRKAGAKVRYTEYPGVNHNSWDNAFAEKELLPWLFSQKKKRNWF